MSQHGSIYLQKANSSTKRPTESLLLYVIFFLFRDFGLVVGGGGDRIVWTVKVLSVFRLVSVVRALCLVVVANAQEYDEDDEDETDTETTSKKCLVSNCQKLTIPSSDPEWW